MLGNLKWAKGAYPTPYGIIEIEHFYDDKGELFTNVSAPDEIEIECTNKNLNVGETCKYE